MARGLKSNKLFKVLILAGLIVSTLTGCLSIGSLTGGRNNSGSADTHSSSNYVPTGDVSRFGVDGARIKGTYSGIFHCARTTTQFIVNINEVRAGIIDGTVQRTTFQFDYRGNKRKGKTLDAWFKGKYDSGSSTLTMRIDKKHPKNTRLHVHGYAWLSGVILPDASGFVMFDAAPLNHQCSMWIARRGNSFPDEWEFLEDEANPKRSLGLFGQRSINSAQRDKQRNQTCAPNLAAWIRQAEFVDMRRRTRQFHTIRMMYSDKYFIPHFGKRFHEIDHKERRLLSIKLNGACLRDRSLAGLGGGTARHMINSFEQNSHVSDPDKAISNIGFNMLFAWLEQAKQHFDYMAKNQGEPRKVKTMLNSLKQVFPLIFPKDKEAFIAYANTRYKQMILPRLEKDLQTELAAKPSSLIELEKLASFEQRNSQRYKEVTRTELAPLTQQVKQYVDQNAIDAAKDFAAGRNGILGITQIDSWKGTFKNVNSIIDSGTRKQMDKVFISRRMVLAGLVLATEKQQFQKQVVQKRAGARAVKASTDYEKNFSRTYAPVLNLPGFVAFKQARQQARDKIMQDSLSSMTSLINSSKHERTLKELELAYFIDSDNQLPAGRKLNAVLEKQRARVAPFQTGSNFKHYLNALYSYDTETLSQLDYASAKPIAESMKQLDKPMSALGTIMEGISGGAIPYRKMMKSAFAGIEEASLIYPVMAYYILNYESKNSACYDSTARMRTVQYRWSETTTRNGMVIDSRSGGHDTQYKVPGKFLDIFEIVFRGDGNSAMAKFADRFFSGSGKIYRDELIKGTQKLMDIDCKSRLVQKMEDNMIKYFWVAKRRLDTAKSKAWQ